MKKEELILSLDGNSDYKQMALELAEKKEDLEFVVKFVKKEQSSLKYKASKIIRLISEEHPEVLKPTWMRSYPGSITRTASSNGMGFLSWQILPDM